MQLLGQCSGISSMNVGKDPENVGFWISDKQGKVAPILIDGRSNHLNVHACPFLSADIV
jgi:hypothetical protein